MAIREVFNTQEGVRGSGSQAQTFVFAVDVLATDAVNDVLFIAPVSGDLIPLSATAYTAGVTGLTSADLGFYKSTRVGGDVFDKDALAAAVDLSGSGSDDMLAAITVANRGKNFRELSTGSTLADTEFVLALTLNTEVTVDGTVFIHMTCAQG